MNDKHGRKQFESDELGSHYLIIAGATMPTVISIQCFHG